MVIHYEVSGRIEGFSDGVCPSAWHCVPGRDMSALDFRSVQVKKLVKARRPARLADLTDLTDTPVRQADCSTTIYGLHHHGEAFDSAYASVHHLVKHEVIS